MIRRPVHSEVALEPGRHVAVGAHDRLATDPASWLPPPGTPIAEGHRVLLSVPTPLPSPEIPAIVTVGVPTCPGPGLLVRSLAWRAETAHELFPTLRADLELHHGVESRLRLVGSYVPPLSVLGALADQVVGRRLADEVIGAFLQAVARQLTSDPSGRPAPGAGVPSWTRGPRPPKESQINRE